MVKQIKQKSTKQKVKIYLHVIPETTLFLCVCPSACCVYKDPQRARLDAVFQGGASLTCGVVAQPRLVGRETERRGQIQATYCGESREVSLMCL